jgi:hypothetical protein
VTIVTQKKENICELKKLATYEQHQGKGYANFEIKYIIRQ